MFRRYFSGLSVRESYINKIVSITLAYRFRVMYSKKLFSMIKTELTSMRKRSRDDPELKGVMAEFADPIQRIEAFLSSARIYDSVESLTEFLMVYYSEGEVIGWDATLLKFSAEDEIRMINERMILTPARGAKFFDAKDVPMEEIILAPGILVVLGYYRGQKTSTIGNMHVSKNDKKLKKLRLPLAEPDAISGAAPRSPLALFTAVHSINQEDSVVVVDSLASLVDALKGVIKAGGLNFSIVNYLDDITRYGWYENMILVVTVPKIVVEEYRTALWGRVPNLLVISEKGKELTCRGSYPTRKFQSEPDRVYRIHTRPEIYDMDNFLNEE